MYNLKLILFISIYLYTQSEEELHAVEVGGMLVQFGFVLFELEFELWS